MDVENSSPTIQEIAGKLESLVATPQYTLGVQSSSNLAVISLFGITSRSQTSVTLARSDKLRSRTAFLFAVIQRIRPNPGYSSAESRSSG